MIPKIIHYCWFGKQPKPRLAIKCIDSWKRMLPDYDIIEWNEGNFDVNISSYTRQAYENRKYAFVSDYARFWILYNYGGVYFDTDVEVVRPIDDIVFRGPFFARESNAVLGYSNGLINPGLALCSDKNNPLFKEVLSFYDELKFIEGGVFNMTTVVDYITNLLKNKGLSDSEGIQIVSGFYIYPVDYFCPLHGSSICFSKNTRTIHHYLGSWKKQSFRKKIVSLVHNVICLFEIFKIKYM